jgi:hypothetical protein
MISLGNSTGFCTPLGFCAPLGLYTPLDFCTLPVVHTLLAEISEPVHPNASSTARRYHGNQMTELAIRQSKPKADLI